MRIIVGVLAPLVRAAHRPTLSGVENLPASGPFLLVANHGAGLGVSEIACLAVMYLDRVGAHRPLAGFAHPIAFRFAPFRSWMQGLGAVPSTYHDGASTLALGVPLLVFPGGDHETLRPAWEHARVDFGGRRGFLKMAKAAGVPIVPLGIRGSHLTAPILWRSRHVLPNLLGLPKLLGLKRWALTALGVVVACAIVTRPWALWIRAVTTWAWLTSPFIFAPVVPCTIRMRIGKPLSAEALYSQDDPTLERALSRVELEVQAIVTELGRE